MKRVGNLYEPICQRANIERAAQLAVDNVEPKKIRRNKPIQYFLAHKVEMLDEVEEMLKTETYTFGPMHSFPVYEPKKRIVHCPPFFPDRIIHHSIVAELEPIVMNNLIRDVYGALKGRGIKQCIERTWEFVKGKGDWYFLKLDIKQFYPSIDHEILEHKLSRLIKDKRFIAINKALIECHSPGIPIGNGTSVWYSNLYLSALDHYAKEQLRIVYYIRFADDILIIVRTKDEAHAVFAAIEKEITALKLTIKNNVRIAPVDYGIDFVGCVFYSTHIRLRKSIKMNLIGTIHWLKRIDAPDEFFKRKTASFIGWCDLCDALNLVRKSFGEKLKLFKRYMDEIPRLSDMRKWFGLSHDRYVKLENMLDRDITMLKYEFKPIRGKIKAVFMFVYPDDPNTQYYAITGSDVIIDRLQRCQEQGIEPPYKTQIYKKISNRGNPYYGIK